MYCGRVVVSGVLHQADAATAGAPLEEAAGCAAVIDGLLLSDGAVAVEVALADFASLRFLSMAVTTKGSQPGWANAVCRSLSRTHPLPLRS